MKIEMLDELIDGRAYADRHVLTAEMTDGTSHLILAAPPTPAFAIDSVACSNRDD